MKWKVREQLMLPAQDKATFSMHTKLWTPANIVTLVRICLVPVFVVALISPWPQWLGLPSVADDMKSLIAAGLFILISCTDWLDGYLARRRDEVTDFGKFMDPLADKILVTAALLALIELGSLPSWVVIVILSREFIVSGVRMVAASEGVVIAASWYGKFKTVFQMIAVVLFTVKDSHMYSTINDVFSDAMWLISWGVMIIALILTVVSMLDYIAKARHLIGFTTIKMSQSKEMGTGEKKTGCAPEHEDVALEIIAYEVLEAARAQGLSLGTAESLTGGLIAATLVNIPGSSDTFRGGIVSYVDEVKRERLGVSSLTLSRYGAVSQQTAQEMAEGALRQLSVDIAVSVTGIAGPDGAEPGKPVGTVWVGLADGFSIDTCCFQFEGDRMSIRKQAVCAALSFTLAHLNRV